MKHVVVDQNFEPFGILSGAKFSENTASFFVDDICLEFSSANYITTFQKISLKIGVIVSAQFRQALLFIKWHLKDSQMVVVFRT